MLAGGNYREIHLILDRMRTFEWALEAFQGRCYLKELKVEYFIVSKTKWFHVPSCFLSNFCFFTSFYQTVQIRLVLLYLKFAIS